MKETEPLTRAQLWKVVFVLILGTFAMGNAKFSIIPLVPTIAQDLDASNQAILSSVFAYFWGGFIGAPILAVLFRHWNKPKILALLSLWCFLGNFLSSFAISAETLYWLRWFSSIPHAAFMAFCTLLICEVVPKSKRGFYLATIMFGLSVSTLIAVPFNTFIGMSHGWEMSFRFVALLDLLIFLLVFDLLPKKQAAPPLTTIAKQLSGLNNRYVWLWSCLGLCVITSTTTAWSFGIAAMGQQTVLGMPIKVVLMIIMGIGFTVGPMIGGLAADKNVHKAIGINTLFTFATLVLLILCVSDYRLGILGVFFISIAFASINIMSQIRLLDFPVTALYLIMCFFNAFIQLGNFLGSILATMAQKNAHPETFMLMTTLPMSALACALWWYLHTHPQPLPHTAS